jgi:hypothetical protein
VEKNLVLYPRCRQNKLFETDVRAGQAKKKPKQSQGGFGILAILKTTLVL